MKIFAVSEIESISYSTVKYKKSINLCSKSITSISQDAKDLKAQSIILCCNQLSSLPQFGINLKVLNLSRNQLKSLPEHLFNCLQLVELDLSFNRISRLSRSIGKMINLKKLSLSNNCLGEIPQDIGQCSRLEVLNLSNNCIYTIPAEFSYLESVKTVLLEGNPLYPVVQSGFTIFPSLRELSARLIKDYKLSTDKLPLHLQDYINSGKKCSHCSKSFFESFVRRGRVIFRGNQNVPIEYKLCKEHWNTEKERIISIFEPKMVINSSLERRSSKVSLRSSNSRESLVNVNTQNNKNVIRPQRALSFSFWNRLSSQ